ncbi:diguanylate cyclase with GAF sensor [Ruminiclostridium papyrosolvens DSM 2782]|uniref:Diguanylate cyclase with GAF sensor n=1 Tax=Ruminiclostridium papyrosolvens DSM 2782 TaxID=588581 RepID=F1TAQ7_9FIRM|nr:GGDEF domain-containing protein [Ruminiclostridium papyrosolvens]EGD48600.1 diguanylate cyclase with GAF sensor [Ruminiclostridium papyrosolvens DSM 2782]WES32644.1 GGDEF domain-containing protein [Ruminiclostridium papyrosolvens DSM 2782]
MNKIQKYEKVMINLYWVFIVLLFSALFFKQELYTNANVYFSKKNYLTVFIVSIVVLNIVKILFVNNINLYSDKAFDVFRSMEVFLTSVFLLPFSDGIEYLSLVLPLFFISIRKGKKLTYLLLGFSAVIKIANIFVLYGIQEPFDASKVVFSLFRIFCIYILLLCIFSISAKIYSENLKNEQENDRLIDELGEKYEQLASAKDEIKNQYETLKETNFKLEDTNKRLTSSIAEFYTLQQVSEAIGSILDINELLNFVNDVIIGVMGVNFSSILLFDQKKNRLKVQFTNITNKEELAILADNVNCELLLDILQNEKPLIENMVDPDKYDFIQTRQIGSFMCVPLSLKSRKFGLTLIEHRNNNTFNTENLRLLTTLGKQVSMAIENAELYANLQEMATVDGLTGVYNRVYFHEKFEAEFKMAEEKGYNLSLVILDIDFFKIFNDTYGHLFGDVVLKEVAQTVKNNLRGTDTIARFGGEEFVLILPRTSIQQAHEKVEFLRTKIAGNVIKDNLISASVTASFGIACYPETSSNQVGLIRDADNALYKAKENGRNCIMISQKIG